MSAVKPPSTRSWPSPSDGEHLRSAPTISRGRIRRWADTRERRTSARSVGARRVGHQSRTSRASPRGDTWRAGSAFSWSWRRVCGVSLLRSATLRYGSQCIGIRHRTPSRHGASCPRESTPWCNSGRCAFGRLRYRRMSAWAATTSSAPLRSNCFWSRRSPQAGPPAPTALDLTHRRVGHSRGGSTTASSVERLASRTEWPHATTGCRAEPGPAERNQERD